MSPEEEGAAAASASRFLRWLLRALRGGTQRGQEAQDVEECKCGLGWSWRYSAVRVAGPCVGLFPLAEARGPAQRGRCPSPPHVLRRSEENPQTSVLAACANLKLLLGYFPQPVYTEITPGGFML